MGPLAGAQWAPGINWVLEEPLIGSGQPLGSRPWRCTSPHSKTGAHSGHGRPISWRNSYCHSSWPSNCSSAVLVFLHGEQRSVRIPTGRGGTARHPPRGRSIHVADLVSAPGRNCHLFAALCKLATRGSDEGLLTWARTLNREFAVTLSDSEVRGIWRSVCRYRARWRVQGHQQGWLWKQAARGRKGGAASGVVRRAGTPLEHDRAPWADLGVSRATWYRRFRAAKVDGESRAPTVDLAGRPYRECLLPIGAGFFGGCRGRAERGYTSCCV